jgi:hypothetical protein
MGVGSSSASSMTWVYEWGVHLTGCFVDTVHAFSRLRDSLPHANPSVVSSGAISTTRELQLPTATVQHSQGLVRAM